MKCSRCQQENPAQASFCMTCGAGIARAKRGTVGGVRSSRRRKRPKSEGPQIPDLEKRLAEVLKREAEGREQQIATSEILRVISESPTDVQPVFDAIATNAQRLCAAPGSGVYRFDGELIHVAALRDIDPAGIEAVQRAYPMPPNRGGATPRAILTRDVVYIRDVTEDREYGMQRAAAAVGYRSILSVPMLRGGTAIGAITVNALEVAAFSDAHVELLKTFADQAVIAIENVRLFTALQQKNEALTQAHAQVTESLEQQTATAEVLKVISRSAFDLQPVLDTLIENAVRLCGADRGFIHRQEGEFYPVAASYGHTLEWVEVVKRNPIRRDRRSATGRAVLERRVVHIPDIQADPEYEWAEDQRGQAQMHRTILAVPMLRDGSVIGVITIRRVEVNPFTDKQIELVTTFADQAVIAIENVRLFNETKEALEQQTATAEILRVISTSPTDLTPVFDTIARSAVRVCDSTDALVALVEGDETVTMAHYGDQAFLGNKRRPITRGFVVGRTVLEARPIQVDDLPAVDDFPEGRDLAVRMGHRTVMAVPLLRDGIALGAILMRRSEVKPFTDKQISLLQTFADQAVIAIENVRLFTELQDKNQALTTAHAQVSEALEQQTATSEVLRVISSSPTDLQPVFDTIAKDAMRLCRALHGVVLRFDGELIHLVALANATPEGGDALRRAFPTPPGRHTAASRAILTGVTVDIPDVQKDPDYGLTGEARTAGYRSIVAVPMLRDGRSIGTLNVHGAEVGQFSERQIQLLKTFADQAVIAIENVRLFTELQEKNRALTEAHAQVTEALEQQTATAEILRVISRSQTDVQPVFDTIVRSAVTLCDGLFSALYQFDGDLIHPGAQHNFTPEALDELHRVFPARPTRALFTGRAILERAVVHVPDSEVDPEHQHRTLRRAIGWRSGLFVPMLREGAPIGVIEVARAEPGPFSDSEIALLKTFADQAVIAIENVRLFKELEARNRDLTEALDRQTSTAEILRVISQSQTELQPVFEAIVDHAMQLFKAWAASVLRVDGPFVRLIATRGGLPGSEQHLREQSPWPIDTPSPVGVCIADRTVVHIADIESDRTVDEGIRDLALKRGWRSILAAPILRDGEPIGAIAIQREEARPFSFPEIELLKTFADQAVIAIENTRLLGELQARTQQLTRSVEELTALGEVSRALGSTLDLDRVLQTIVIRASQLAGTDACSVFEYDEATEAFHLRATNNLDAEVVALARQTPTRRGEGVQGRMALTRQPVQVPDIAAEDAYHGPLRDILLRTGTRAVLAVPMLRENELIGGLTVNKRTPGEFSPEAIELLTTFATQSALAIQNARLFREIEQKSRELEAASRHKSEFLANMSHELRTPLNAVIGFSEVLTERMFGDLNEKQDEYLKDIHASGQHLLSLINDILDLSKIEAGRMELEVTDFDLPMAIDNAMTLIRERAARRSIALHTTVDERLGQVQADERKIRQVLLNLLSNAIKFTPEGGRIEVGAKPVDGSIEVSVTDTGVGIAPEDQEAVFEEFRQVGTADKKVEGTGLGLALSRKFIELHGGKIWVKSQVGEGSTFTFTVPVRRGE
jgi:GAF domain-containing protein